MSNRLTHPVAPEVDPAAVELNVQGEISGVSVLGAFKTACRRPSCVSPDHTFQLATYHQITPGTSGEVRIDSLVKTQTTQIVQQAYTVGEPDIRATQVLYPMAPNAMGSGMYYPNRQSFFAARSTAISGSIAKGSSAAGYDRPKPHQIPVKQ